VLCQAGRHNAHLFDQLLIEDRVMREAAAVTSSEGGQAELDERADMGYQRFVERMAHAAEVFVSAAEV
jgi:hypothetical protein